MKKLLVLSALLLIASCNESTRERRLAYSTSSSGYSTGNNYYNGNTGSSSGGVGTTTSTTTTSSSSITIPSEVSHCSWSTDGSTGFASTSSHLGKYTLCKSSTTDTVLYLQLATIPSTQVCIIPTTNVSGYGTTYIGEPRCVQVTSNTTLYKITMLKNRSGYTSSTMTGAMMMKDLVYYTYGYPYLRSYYAVDAYLLCYQYLYYGDSRYCQVFNAKGEHVYQAF